MSEHGASDGGRELLNELRLVAERRLAERKLPAAQSLPEADARALLHELQVHQIELEMQNEELLRAQVAAEEAAHKYFELFDFAPIAYYLWDAQGRIVEANMVGAALLGLTRKAVLGKRFGQFVATKCLAKFADFCRLVLATDTQQNCEVEFAGGGQPVHLLVEGIAVKDRPGQGKLCCAAVIDVSPQKRACDLAAANKTLQSEIAMRKHVEAANMTKSQFLANMSHELRTPMTAILGMIDVALPRASDLTVKDCLETAKGSADLLLSILNDLLDSAKIDSGKLELETAPLSLRRMLDQMMRVLSLRAAEKRLGFVCHIAQGTPDAVLGDRTRLEQILLNLAGNAIKFTERGEVKISVRSLSDGSEATLEFTVHDTGIGIPPSRLERLFQPFTQADASMTRQFGGTGLRLSICKSLVEMMGGRISVESEQGVGSKFCFTVCLPLAAEIPADLETQLPLPVADRVPLHILLVEDTPANQKLATYVLQGRGHRIEIAGDGQEANYLTQHNDYDVILMDVQMPEMNGLDATAAIRKREAGGRRVPIIAMTAHSLKSDRERFLAAGMDGYLSKPINAQEMIRMVERLGARAKARLRVLQEMKTPDFCSPFFRPAVQSYFLPQFFALSFRPAHPHLHSATFRRNTRSQPSTAFLRFQKMKGMIDTPLARHWFMHTSHASVGLAASAKVNAARPPLPVITARQPELPKEARTLRVGLIAGPEAIWELAVDLVAEHLLGDASLYVDTAWDCIELGIDDSADYDCLVLLGWPPAMSRQRIKRIELHCRGGGSVVALRAMHAEIPGWSNFTEDVLGGRQLPGQKCRLMEVEKSGNAWHHPVVDGIATMIAEGEVYNGPRFSPDTTVLLRAASGEPVAWTARHEGGRVFCTTLGAEDDFRQRGFLRLISNAIHWTGLIHAG